MMLNDWLLADWHTMMVNLFDLGTGLPAVSVLEKLLRPVAVYLLLVLMLRRFGRRILAQLNPFDLVVLLMLSNTVQNAIIGNDTSLLGGVIGALSLVGVNALLVRIYYRGPEQEKRTIESLDTYFIRNHHVDNEALRRLHVNRGELIARAHERGFDDLDEVDTAVLYPNGTIYMTGTSKDEACLQQILKEILALRQDLASQRG
jgi:uncharacterized membrane protein YcaP (DUF421 family)